MKIDLLYLTVLSGTVLPVLVNLVTKRRAPNWMKSVANGGLALVATGLSHAIAVGGVLGDWRKFLLATAVTFGTSTLTHLGLWKSLGLTGADGAIAKLTAPFGFGPKPFTLVPPLTPTGPSAGLASALSSVGEVGTPTAPTNQPTADLTQGVTGPAPMVAGNAAEATTTVAAPPVAPQEPPVAPVAPSAP